MRPLADPASVHVLAAMELRHLAQIVEICRAGGFSGAAKRLGVSQPTLSKSIARLEDSLALKLFDRSMGGAATPTALGSLLAQRAEDILGSVEALRHDLEQIAEGDEGRINIGVGPVARLRPLPEVIRSIGEHFPRLHIRTEQTGGAQVMEALRKRRFDLVFGAAEHAAPYGELIRIHLYDDEVVAAVRPGHPALKAEPVGPTELAAYPIALSSLMPTFRVWLGPAADRVTRNAFISDDYALIRSRPLEADHVAIAPRFIFADALQAGELVVLAWTWRKTYSCWMLTTPERWHSPVIRAIADLARIAVSERGNDAAPAPPRLQP